MPADPFKPTLLLVEDDENDAFFFRRKLQQSGLPFQIERALDGRAAIEYLRNASASKSLPSAVFLDLKMPILNGFDVLMWMQKQKFDAPIRAIILSGSEEQQDMDRARQLGAAEYLVKPVKVADFHHCLRDVPTVSGASRKKEAPL